MKYLPIVLGAGILALLLVVAGCRKQQATVNPTPPTRQTETSATAPPPTAGVKIGQDEASCPVLGTVMKKSAMIPVQHNGKTYDLCCRECVAQFKADPEKYIQHPATPTREMRHDEKHEEHGHGEHHGHD
ncbi:MAG: hypothetical protein ACYC7E_11000 [Armatimonadota bacterium]